MWDSVLKICLWSDDAGSFGQMRYSPRSQQMILEIYTRLSCQNANMVFSVLWYFESLAECLCYLTACTFLKYEAIVEYSTGRPKNQVGIFVYTSNYIKSRQHQLQGSTTSLTWLGLKWFWFLGFIVSSCVYLGLGSLCSNVFQHLSTFLLFPVQFIQS